MISKGTSRWSHCSNELLDLLSNPHWHARGAKNCFWLSDIDLPFIFANLKLPVCCACVITTIFIFSLIKYWTAITWSWNNYLVWWMDFLVFVYKITESESCACRCDLLGVCHLITTSARASYQHNYALSQAWSRSDLLIAISKKEVLWNE